MELWVKLAIAFSLVKLATLWCKDSRLSGQIAPCPSPGEHIVRKPMDGRPAAPPVQKLGEMHIPVHMPI